MKVNIKEVAGELQTLSGDDYFFYDKTTGELEWFNENNENPNDLEIDDIENDPNYVALPTKFDFDDYGIMKDFMFAQEDEKIRNEINDAIHRRGAFGNFRNVVERYGLLQTWYDFKQAEYEDHVKDWCEVNGLEWE